jgi:tRNA (guanine-N7-)-methyltransferase
MVRSSQAGVHPRLDGLLGRHAVAPWRAPLHRPTVAAFAALRSELGDFTAPLVLDSGCGTGASTRQLAHAFPDCLVIGVDKSAARLARLGARRFPHREGNAIWLRGELTTFWRLALASGWRLERHYLLYPNPWPKPGQLQRRWHAHPVFPVLLALGGRIELRSNWELYAREFARAAARLTGEAIEAVALAPAEPLTPFERKYRGSGHALYSVVVPDVSESRVLERR